MAIRELTTGLMPHAQAEKFLLELFQNLGNWPIKSAEAFRNASLNPEATFAVNPVMTIQDENEVKFIQNLIRDTIREGRMIDFGFIPNIMIKSEAVDSYKMFENSELQHPYETWLGVTSWEGGYNGYLITRNPINTDILMIYELYGISVPGFGDVILLYDIVSAIPSPEGTRRMPSSVTIPETPEEENARCANSLEPLVTMLRLIADASIPITQTPAPIRLNAARVKQGKFPIPQHTVVHTRDYVTMFHTANPQVKRNHANGHHASPVAHWRKAHVRHLSTGKVVSVRSSKVNWRDSEEMHRLFYRV